MSEVKTEFYTNFEDKQIAPKRIKSLYLERSDTDLCNFLPNVADSYKFPTDSFFQVN